MAPAMRFLTCPFLRRGEQVKSQIAKCKRQSAEMNEQCGNVIENKGQGLNAELGRVDYELGKVGGMS